MQNSRRILVALALMATVVASGMPSALAAFPGENGLIAYRHESEIFTMNGDGSNNSEVPNTAAPQYPQEVAWSPDGNHLAFASDRDLWTIDANGDNLRNITNSPDFQDAQPAWSPDGTEIAFASYRDSKWQIYVVRSSDGGGERQLTEDTGSSTLPAWSPDGSTIAFSSDRTQALGLYTMAADTGESETFIAPTSTANMYPSWFPDGSKIAYRNFTDLWVTDPGGSSPTQLTTDAQVSFGLSVSPDGTKIAFASGRDGNQEIYVVNADGSGQVNITNSPSTDDRLPDWGVPGTDDGGVQNGTEEDDDLSGSSEDDTVYAGAGDDVVTTLGGPDVAYGEEGNDTISGGAGNDKLYGDFGPAPASASRSGRRVRMQQEPAPGNDVLKGGGGNDVAVGGPGADTINGGPGIDRMKGGPGEDTCVFSSKKELKRSSSCERKTLNF